jgi:hypothetical protein
VRFVVDGVFVYENQTMEELIENENEFIKRISNLSNAHEKPDRSDIHKR